ncbi:LysR family transcriptional regulator [Bacillus sp. RG28]|uniref:LysR family transcriptional regulator n=1 Tax=Gottfriedia endophytica TaxID=2820819 RepID=A0A940NM01_9BACI|nr:LysR family transcriptional regulator [Gottfriedia endophytica]MBP0724634.1 LysR family transcriptional regulator [Gottfriedia endophytica]
MELRQLHYFLTVAEELHFGRAAKRLQMTQPPLSQQIQQLENELGVLLFKRTKRHVELTKAGTTFLEGVTRTLEQLNQTIDSSQRAQRGEIGKLEVGFVGSATYDILPPLIREYQNQYPNVELKLQELSTPNQINELDHQKLDIGFVRPPIQGDAITSEIIHETPCILALPKHHPLTKEKEIQVSMLQNQPFIVVSRNIWPELYDDIVALCRNEGFSLQIKQEATEYQTVIGLIAAGIGIAIVPASMKNYSVKDVVYREIANANLTAKMAIAYQKDRLTSEAGNFIKLIRKLK